MIHCLKPPHPESPTCYVWVCSYQHHTIAIGWQSLSAAFAQRRELGLQSLLAGSHKLITPMYLQVWFIRTYLSFLGRETQKTVSQVFLYTGLKLCYRCSFRGVRERICVVEPSDECSRDDGSITQHTQQTQA